MKKIFLEIDPYQGEEIENRIKKQLLSQIEKINLYSLREHREDSLIYIPPVKRFKKDPQTGIKILKKEEAGYTVSLDNGKRVY